MKVLLALALILIPGAGLAQDAQNSPRSSYCKAVTVNVQGSSGADITVDNTSGGVLVLAASTDRCAAAIRNTGTADMRCSPAGQTPSATVGFLVDAGATLTLGAEAQQAWRCFRTTATNATANVAESVRP